MYTIMHALALLTYLTTVIGVFGASISNIQGSLQHPNRTVTLIYPDLGGKVNLGQEVFFGAGDLPTGYGFVGNISISIRFPNGTTKPFGNCVSSCNLDPNPSSRLLAWTVNFVTDANGPWQLMWNYNYTYYPDTSKVNSSECAAGPSSSETFVLTHDFVVQPREGMFDAGMLTITTQLPSQPTGFYQTNPNRSGASSIKTPLVIVLVGLVVVMMGN